ncbi:MAG TPA: sialidase family protein [Candidatus Thermoplasmatota archaeon]|nr:sialidase family protein [Candidatus Thermoplasmatota archaeon]
MLRRESALALSFVALLLAGCAAPGAGVEPAASLLPPLALGGIVAMEQPTGGAEPNIAILPDGTIFITAVAGSQERPNHATGAAWLWRSTDGGATWETLRAPVRETPLGSVPGTRRPFGSSDADVVASPDGWVYYSDWWNWGAPVTWPVAPPVGVPVSPFARYGSYLVERSSDGGLTWESTPITTLDSLGGIDRQWLVAGENGWVALFYAYFHGANPTRPADLASGIGALSSIMAVYSTDHGATWSDPRPVVGPTREGFSQIAHPDLVDGLLWMPHGYTPDGPTYWTDPSEVRVALSTDLGATWTDVKVADVPGGFDNLWAVQGDAEPDGTLHVAWAARTGDTMTVFHSESRDRGATWSEPEVVRSAGTNFLPWVAAKAGEVAVSWYGSDAAGDPSEAPEDTQWRLYVAVRRDGAWSIATTPDPVKVGPMCAKGASCAGERELLDYAGIAYGPDGTLHTSFATSREVAGVKAGLVHYAPLR